MAKQQIALSDWDKLLLAKHLPFYQSLHKGRRKPTTLAQKHFVAVLNGEAKAETQHEVAYARYLKASRLELRYAVEMPVPAKEQDKMITTAMLAIDRIDTAAISRKATAGLLELFGQLRSSYQAGAGSLKSKSAEAALWVQTIVADRQFGHEIEQWLGAHGNTVSDIYTKAMDGSHALGLKDGLEYVSPTLHRLFGGHTPIEAWTAIKKADPNDTLTQELVGLVRSLGSDFTSVIGLPVVTMTKESFGQLDTFANSIGIPTAWLVDILHENALEMASATLPIFAGIYHWNRAETSEFASMIGSVGLTATVAANPIAILVFLILLARSFSAARGKADMKNWASAIANGGALSGLVLASGAVIGGPAWLGVMVGIVVAGVLRRQKGISPKVLSDQLARIVRATLRREKEQKDDSAAMATS